MVLKPQTLTMCCWHPHLRLPWTWTCEVEVSDGSVSGGTAGSQLVENGCLYGEYDCPGSSRRYPCQWGSIGDGIYYIEPDGNGNVDVYCDMANGGWTLLLSADGQSTYWGNNSPNWPHSQIAPSSLGTLTTMVQLQPSSHR